MMKNVEGKSPTLQVGDILAEFFAKKMEEAETNNDSSSSSSKDNSIEKKKKKKKHKKRKHRHKKSKKRNRHSSESKHKYHKDKKRKHETDHVETTQIHKKHKSDNEVAKPETETKTEKLTVPPPSTNQDAVTCFDCKEIKAVNRSSTIDIQNSVKVITEIPSSTNVKETVIEKNSIFTKDILSYKTVSQNLDVEKSKTSINEKLTLETTDKTVFNNKFKENVKVGEVKNNQICTLDVNKSVDNLHNTSKKEKEDKPKQTTATTTTVGSVSTSTTITVTTTMTTASLATKSRGKIVIKDLKSSQILQKLTEPEKFDSLEEGEISTDVEKVDTENVTIGSDSSKETSGDIADNPIKRKLKKKKEKHRHKKKKRRTSRRHLKRSRSRDDERYHGSRYHDEKHPKLSRRSRSPSPQERKVYDLREKIDKARLLQVAQRNVIMMIEQGTLPKGVNIDSLKQEQLMAMKTGGKSVQELTDFCRAISQRERDDDSCSNSSQERHSDVDAPFIHHPFKLKEQQPFIINIKNAIQLPTKTPAEKVAEAARLRTQFPVSSGSQHRQKELQWVPVEEENKKQSSKSTTLPALPGPVVAIESPQPTVIVDVPKSKISTPPPPPPPSVTSAIPSTSIISLNKPSVNTAELNPCIPPIQQNSDSQLPGFDVSTIVAQRLKAVRRLQENPNDVEALNQMFQSQQKMQAWVQSKQLPGQYTGSTDVRLLSAEELTGPPVWVKKDQFSRAMPVKEGIGMHLLRKMGWNPGEGLGKNKEGVLEPLMLDVKTDKKGLVSDAELAKKIPQQSIAKDLSGKHPVSALMELCSKRKWKAPEFNLIDENGPDHRKTFLFRVNINGVEYQPTCSSPNKKHAKAQAATVCLQSLGLLPRDLNNPL